MGAARCSHSSSLGRIPTGLSLSLFRVLLILTEPGCIVGKRRCSGSLPLPSVQRVSSGESRVSPYLLSDTPIPHMGHDPAAR